MSVERVSNGMYDAVCDSCGMRLRNFDSFDEAVQGMKDAGWKSRKENYGGYEYWENVCDDCLRIIRETGDFND